MPRSPLARPAIDPVTNRSSIVGAPIASIDARKWCWCCWCCVEDGEKRGKREEEGEEEDDDGELKRSVPSSFSAEEEGAEFISGSGGGGGGVAVEGEEALSFFSSAVPSEDKRYAFRGTNGATQRRK
jgi:hypothetical protein